MAKLFLESTDTSYKVSSNNTTVYGATGDQAVTIDAGLTGITLDALIERVQFTGATTDYKYVQAGTDLKVYNSANALVTTVGLQDDTTGTQLTFANGTVKAAIVPVVGGAPTFSVGGTAVTAIGATATPVAVVPATIDGAVSSAPAAVFSVSAPTTSVTEATGATASFTVSLNAAQPAATTVKVATGSVGSSAATLDYGLIALTPVTGGATLDADGTVHFPAGITTATITVPVVVDSIAETGEGVSLTLSSPNTGATVGTATATVLIADPATPIFSLAASATSAVEGTPVVGSVAAATSGTVTLTVTRSGNLTGTDSVDLTATPGTALASDYGIAATTGQTGIVLPKVTFAPTETTKTITFTPVADSIRESNETLTVSLTNATTGASISTTGASVALTITDDDLNQLPVITIPTTTPSAFISESTPVSGVSFADADDNIGFEVTVTAAGASQVSFSTLSSGGNVVTAKNAAGTALTDNQTANSITLSGTKADVNVVLSKLKYTTNSTSPTSEAVTIAVKDTAGGVTTKTLAINIGQSGKVSSTTSLLGTSGDDSFSGTLAEFTTFSTALLSITGGLGSDKLTLTGVTGVSAALPTPTAANVTGVEILDLNAALVASQSDAFSFSASKFDASLTTVNFTTNNSTVAGGTADANDTLTATNANAGTTFNIQNTAGTLAISAVNATTPGAADTFTVNLAGGVTLSGITQNSNLSVIDILNINSNGTTANAITSAGIVLTAGTNPTINVAGAAALTLGTLPDLGTTGKFIGTAAAGKITVTANGNDNADITGGSAGDALTGGLGNDSISGGLGNDTINGGAGSDVITGGAGTDSLSGGGLSGDGTVDTFVFAPGDSGSTAGTIDTITDLKEGDFIKIGAYAANALTKGATIPTSATSTATKDIYIDTIGKYIVIETAADGSTSEKISIGTVASAAFTYNTGSDAASISDDYLVVGAAPLTQVNDAAAGTLTISGKAYGNVATVVSDSLAPTVGGSVIGAGAVTTVVASGITGTKGLNQYLTGTVSNALSVTGSEQADSISGGTGNDALNGGSGADYIIGDSAGTFRVEALKVTATAANVMTVVLAGVTISGGTGDASTAATTAATLNTNIQADPNHGKLFTSSVSTDTVTITYLENYGTAGTVSGTSITVTNTPSTAGVAAGASDVITGGAGDDTILAGNGADTITGGTGADSIYLAESTSSIDKVIVAAGDSVVTFGGTGNSGTITGYDSVYGLTVGTASVNSDELDVGGTAAIAANATATTDSVLTISSTVVSSLKVTSGAVAFYSGNDGATGALTVNSTATLAAAVQALTLNDIGSAGDTVYFTATISSVAHTFVYTQSNATAGGDLIDLVGTTATSLITTNATTGSALFIS